MGKQQASNFTKLNSKKKVPGGSFCELFFAKWKLPEILLITPNKINQDLGSSYFHTTYFTETPNEMQPQPFDWYIYTPQCNGCSSMNGTGNCYSYDELNHSGKPT